MSLNIANCPRCGRVFAKGIRDVCHKCYENIENEYNICIQYLRDNKGATIKELSDETNVSVKQITKFIKEGRISLYNAPNLSYPCESCGVLIRDGTICEVCRSRLTTDVNRLKELEAQKLAEKQALRHAQTYKIDSTDK